MATPLNKSLWKSLILSITPIVIGTLIFGMIIESYKSDLNFRGDIMKEYYTPLINKERQCSNISNTLSNDFHQKIGLYNELVNRYNANKDGSGPRLTEEYKTYLNNLLKKTFEYNEKSDNHYKGLMLCRQELHQDFINIALVTGTINQFNTYNNQLDSFLTTLDLESQQKSAEVRNMLSNVNPDKIINDFFIAGDLGDERYSANDTDNAINQTLKPLLSFFAFKADIENKVNGQYLELYKNYNSVLEEEISARYKRNWLSKIFN